MATEPDQLVIFDTTLRDGEQAPGCSMTRPREAPRGAGAGRAGRGRHRGRIPRRLATATSSPCALIAREIRGPIICGLARCGDNDIERAWQALREARTPAHARVHRHQPDPSRAQAEHEPGRSDPARGGGRARGARAVCDDVEFSAEDAARTELDYLAEVVQAVIEAGATTVNIPDTVGYAVPAEFAELHRLPAPERARHRARGAQRALPRRPGPGGGQQPGGGAGRRPPGRVHHQRHRRARRQLRAGRDRDGGAHARRPSSA